MSETLNKEYRAENLQKETSPKVTGAVFVLLAVLVFAIGFMVHYIQVGVYPEDTVIPALVAQLHLKFAIDCLVGFLTGIFTVIGIYYLKQKPQIPEEISEVKREEESNQNAKELP